MSQQPNNKEATRNFLTMRQLERGPLPSQERIRELMGWTIHQEEKFRNMGIEWDITVTACTA